MKKFLALLILIPLIIESKTYQETDDELPHMNEYFCQIDGISFNLNWDENIENTKEIITIEPGQSGDKLAFDSSDKHLGRFGLGEIIFRQSSGGLKKHDFFFTEGASHESNFIKGFYISGADRPDIVILHIATFLSGEAMMTFTGSDEVRKGNCKFLKTYTKRLP